MALEPVNLQRRSEEEERERVYLKKLEESEAIDKALEELDKK